MKIIYSKKHEGHNPPYEIYDGKYEPFAEKADRLTSIVNTFQENGIKKFYNPYRFPLSYINKIHLKEYVSFLRRKSGQLEENEILYPSYFIMDTYTPVANKTYEAARSAVDVALTGAKYLLDGEKITYALCRPPGHHAESKNMGGYCYFNNASVAADYLSRHGKVAILDIDIHHGNGTQNIFYNRSDVFYVSIHADPREKFPYSSGFEREKGVGVGLGFNKNYPLASGTTDDKYLPALSKALKDIQKFDPTFLVLSAGFDTYEKDPIGNFKLTIPFYETIGRKIAKLRLPTVIVQEGGYHVEDLGKIALSFLKGIAE